MDKEFTDKHPDVAKSWLKAELDAQRFLADPANADEIVRIAQSQTEGFSAADLRTRSTASGPSTKAAAPTGSGCDCHSYPPGRAPI